MRRLLESALDASVFGVDHGMQSPQSILCILLDGKCEVQKDGVDECKAKPRGTVSFRFIRATDVKG